MNMDVMENLIVDIVEYEFRSSADSSVLLITFRVAQILTCLLVLGTNVPMIIFIMNQGSRTFLDKLIVFDCFLCLANLHVIILIGFSDDDISFCIFHIFLSFFFNLCNRLLTLAIAIYRTILVFGSPNVVTTHSKKVMEIIIPNAIFLISANLTGWAMYYRNDYRSFVGDNSIVNCQTEGQTVGH